MQHKYLLAIDWLAYSAYGIVGEMSIFSNYKIVPKAYGSQVFKNIASIINTHTLEEVAQLQYNPRSSALKPNLVIVKIANRFLYECDYVELINDINTGLNLEYNAISRLDICADFYTFEKVHPQELIRGFLRRKYRRFGKSKYVLHGNQDAQHEYEYLRFGSPTSEVMVYLYNKSLEMREVKHKPYIVRRWSMLDYKFDDITPPPDVWRLEFRLNTNNLQAIDEHGQFAALHPQDLINSEKMKILFCALCDKFWRWSHSGKAKFVDCVPISMFDYKAGAFNVMRERTDARAEVRKAISFLEQLDEVIADCGLGIVAEDILKRQYHAQLPIASRELKKKNKHKSKVSWIKHWMQSKDVFTIDPITYAFIDTRLKYTYPEAYERAKLWAEVNRYRNMGDDF